MLECHSYTVKIGDISVSHLGYLWLFQWYLFLFIMLQVRGGGNSLRETIKTQAWTLFEAKSQELSLFHKKNWLKQPSLFEALQSTSKRIILENFWSQRRLWLEVFMPIGELYSTSTSNTLKGLRFLCRVWEELKELFKTLEWNLASINFKLIKPL